MKKQSSMHTLLAASLILFLKSQTTFACDLKVEQSWVRAAPPTVVALAGYAVLSNTAGQPLRVVGIESPAFAEVSAHETTMTNGVARMKPIDPLVVPANAKVELAPGGKHLMLLNAKQTVQLGDVVVIKLKDDRGCVTTANFRVTGDATEHGDMHQASTPSEK